MPNEAETVLQQAGEALKSEQYARAEALQRRGCELLREQREEQSRFATELEKLADIHYAQNKFGESASEYAEVLNIREKFLPKDDSGILTPLYRLAKSHFEGQKYESAEVEMRKGVSLAEGRNDSPETVAFFQYELGWLLYYVGKYQDSEPHLLKALSICDATDGMSHQQTIRVLGGIALLYSNCSNLGKDPEPYFRRVIEATKSDKDLRETHLTNLCRFASYLADRKNFEEADESFSQLVALLNEAALSSDAEIQWIKNSCVEYFQSRGKEELVAHLVPAIQQYNAYGDMVQKRLEHAEQTLSQDDPEYAEALLAAGNSLTFEGKFQEAEPLLMRGLNACMKIHGEKSFQTLFALNRVCIIKRALEKFDEAESAIQQAVTGARRDFFDDKIYPWTLENLAALRETQARTDDAARIYAEAVSEYERIFGLASCETAEALYHQSGCLLRMGRIAPAEASIRRAISVMDKIESLSAYEKSDYLSTLASILQAAGRNSEAIEMQRRSEQLFQEAKQEQEDEDDRSANM